MNLSQRLIDTLADCALSLKVTLRIDRTRGSPLGLPLGQGDDGLALFAPGYVSSFIEVIDIVNARFKGISASYEERGHSVSEWGRACGILAC